MQNWLLFLIRDLLVRPGQSFYVIGCCLPLAGVLFCCNKQQKTMNKLSIYCLPLTGVLIGRSLPLMI